MHKPRIHGLAVQTGVWLRAKETEISAALWAYGSGRTLRLLYVLFQLQLLKILLKLIVI